MAELLSISIYTTLQVWRDSVLILLWLEPLAKYVLANHTATDCSFNKVSQLKMAAVLTQRVG